MDMPPEARMWLLATGHYLPRCLHVLAELGIADAIGEAPVPIGHIADAVGGHADSLARMMRLAAAHGVFERRHEGWAHTPFSELLRSDHPRSMRPMFRMMGSGSMWAAAGALAESARTGATGAEIVLGRPMWDHYRDNPEEARVFDAAMTAKSRAEIAAIRPVFDLKPYGRVADVGGGRGHLLAALLEDAPDATGLLCDLPAVVAAAPPHPRIDAVAVDFFRDALPAADAYILCNILHDWADAQAAAILRAIARAAPAGATLIVVESLLGEAPGPDPTKVLDVAMLAATGGRERTRGEYEALLDTGGFRLTEIVPTPTVSIIKGVPA